MATAMAGDIAARTGIEAQPRAATASRPTPAEELRNRLELIETYIPSSALATFIGIYAVINPPAASAPLLRLVLVVLGVVMVWFATWVGFKFRVGATHRWKFIGLSVIGTVAFLAWVLAMPGGPVSGNVNLLGASIAAAHLGAAGVFLTAFFMPAIASALHLR
jgi:hypothetical protein